MHFCVEKYVLFLHCFEFLLCGFFGGFFIIVFFCFFYLCLVVERSKYEEWKVIIMLSGLSLPHFTVFPSHELDFNKCLVVNSVLKYCLTYVWFAF